MTKNATKAVEWTERGADTGNMFAQYNLGVFSRDGTGVPQDYKKSLEWFEKSATAGHAGAMNEIGRIYANGKRMLCR